MAFVLAVALGVAVAPGPVASADPSVGGTGPGSIGVGDSRGGDGGPPEVVGGSSRSPRRPGWGRRPARPRHPYPVVRIVGGGTYCVVTATTTDAGVAARRLQDATTRRRFLEANGLRPVTQCPPPPGGGAGGGGTPAPAPRPASVAESFWEDHDLPAPAPRLEPAAPVVGKDAFLVIGGEPAFEVTVDNPLGADVTIAANSSYVVDWGDGTVQRTSSRGGAWPDGDLRHMYARSGRYTVTVAQEWSASYATTDGATGTLDGLRTVGTVADVTVRQVQAVRH